MPRASDFRINADATADDINKLNLSLSHLEMSSYGASVMQQAVNAGVRITFIHDGQDR